MNIHSLHLKAHFKNALIDIKAGDFSNLFHKGMNLTHKFCDLTVAYCQHHPLRCGLLIGGAVLAVVLLTVIVAVAARKKSGQQPAAQTPVDDAVALYVEKNKPE
jgi:hypothetical protein